MVLHCRNSTSIRVPSLWKGPWIFILPAMLFWGAIKFDAIGHSWKTPQLLQCLTCIIDGNSFLLLDVKMLSIAVCSISEFINVTAWIWTAKCNNVSCSARGSNLVWLGAAGKWRLLFHFLSTSILSDNKGIRKQAF